MGPVKLLPARDLDLILDRTGSLWEEVRGQRIFVTGGTGFFGCWLVESFCRINQALGLNASLVILTRNPANFATKCPHLASNPAVSLHSGDVRSFAFPDGSFDYVVHGAADTSVKAVAATPRDTFSTIVDGTERVLQFATAAGARKFLFLSSGAVYGKQPPELTHVPETYNAAPDPMVPTSVYGESKRAAEQLCTLYQQEGHLECKVARCWTFCGPHLALDQHFAIGNFIADALGGRPIRIRGDGTPRRSYLYTADLAIWLWSMLFRAPGLVPFNVGSARDVSILELARTVVTALDAKVEIQVAQTPHKEIPPLRYVPCVDRARSELGLVQSVDLIEMIRRTANWHRS